MSFRIGLPVDKLYTTHIERKLLDIVPNYLTKVCALIIVDFLTEERFMCERCDHAKPRSWEGSYPGMCDGCGYLRDLKDEYERDFADDRLLSTGEFASYGGYQTFYDQNHDPVFTLETTASGRVFQHSRQDSY